MPLLLLILLAGVLLWLAINRHRSTLTRACRWRLDRSLGPGHYHCAVCGATCDLAPGQRPNACLAPRG